MDAKRGFDEGPGVLHVAPLLDHGLFEVGPWFLVVGLVDDSPVVSSSLSGPEVGGRGIAVGCFVRPPQGGFHGMRLHHRMTVSVSLSSLLRKTGIFF